MPPKFTSLFALSAILALGGCSQAPSNAAATAETLGHTRLCEVKDWEPVLVKEACMPGQKIVFLPNRWGNAQLPILFAAVNCDLRYSVALTEGAVTCIYAPASVEAQQPSTENPGAG